MVLTVEDCTYDLSESYLDTDDVEPLRNNVLSHLPIEMLNEVRMADVVRFRTPDGRYIGLKCRYTSIRMLDRL